MNKQGHLFVYSGPSGVGKGTLLRPYLESHSEAVLSISMTTRQARPGETNGVEYYFVTHEEFEKKIAEDGFLEHAHYSGNFYGTPRSMVEEKLAEGKDVVLEIEVQGAMKIKETFPKAVFIFILPPSFETLRERLSVRATEKEEAVRTRLETALRELGYAHEYDYLIVNDDAKIAGEQLAAVITAAKCEKRAMAQSLKDLIEGISGK